DMAGAPALQFFPWPDVDAWGESKLAQADKHTNAGMLRERFNYYCEKVVKGFYKNHFLRFDRQIVLVDCLQPLNSGPQAFNDMRLALTQLMQSFHYGQRTLFRRLFSPVIDKLLFAATKADHVTIDQHANMVSLLQQLIQDAWQNAAFEGISMDCLGLASVQATTSGIIDVNGEKIPALRGNRLSDGAPLTVYPGEVPARLPGQAFWDKQGFQFEAFRPQVMDVDKPLPHIRLDAALEFLIGDKLR
ncbi:YcjX family protein, partial [Escherichia coli O157:H7]